MAFPSWVQISYPDQKIGRPLLIFQQTEQALKNLKHILIGKSTQTS
jgi:hypothetical protein